MNAVEQRDIADEGRDGEGGAVFEAYLKVDGSKRQRHPRGRNANLRSLDDILALHEMAFDLITTTARLEWTPFSRKARLLEVLNPPASEFKPDARKE